MGAACAAPAKRKNAATATILMAIESIRLARKELRRRKRRRRLQMLFRSALGVGGLELFGGDEAVPVGIDLAEVLGHARRAGLGFLEADPPVTVGIELFPVRAAHLPA